MLTCAMCGRVIKECCDIYEEAEDTTTGKTVYLCGECAAQLEAEFCDRHECRPQKEEP